MRSFPAATVADAPYAAPRWRTRALAATALAALLAPFVLGGLALNESRQLHAAQLLETRLMFARAVMSQVAMAVSWGQAAMRAVALQPGPRVALEGGEASEAAVVIDGLMRSTLLHAAVAIVAADGRVVAVAPRGSAPMFARLAGRCIRPAARRHARARGRRAGTRRRRTHARRGTRPAVVRARRGGTRRARLRPDRRGDAARARRRRAVQHRRASARPASQRTVGTRRARVGPRCDELVVLRAHHRAGRDRRARPVASAAGRRA